LPGLIFLKRKHLKSPFIVWGAIAIIVTLLSPLASIANAVAENSKADPDAKLVRVLAQSEEKTSAAIKEGCKIVKETKGLQPLICRSQVASLLGLPEDIRMYALDAAANSQVSADFVHMGTNDGNGRRIVVIDTGYNYNHPDLSSSYLGGWDFVNNDNDPADDHGHGSVVAGLITADGKNSKAKGAASGTGIIAGKVLDSSGSGYLSDVVNAMYWAVNGPDGKARTADDFKADAINLSLGTSDVYKTYCNDEMPDMTAAIKYAVNRGVVVVVAAGNSGSLGVSIPGCISYSTTVGAVNSLDKIASYSGRGKGVDITAPGVNLISTWLDDGYYRASGTSLATPIISAAVALIKHEHPSYSPSEVQSALFSTAEDLGRIGRDNSYGYGRVVISAAVQ
jgi:subtilisin family serine protease